MISQNPPSDQPSPASPTPTLPRGFGLFHATALNMSNMIGVGPFITIPLIMSAMGGPQAMIGWLVAILIALPDSMIWSELGAAMPGSGGSYLYLREGFGPARWGRLAAFLFIWQFLVSGPMEIASGYLGFARYLNYVWPALTPTHISLIAAAMGVLNIILLYRRINSIRTITALLWGGTILTTFIVIIAGAFNFSPRVAFDFPPNAFAFSWGFVAGLGTAANIGIYDYLGYYDVCYIGDEVRDPGRVIPRSIIYSLVAVALIYFLMNLSIIGVVPWREFVPADGNPKANYVVSLFMERIFGHGTAVAFTLMILWTALASVFALLLGYSRIPYAAALDGMFFRVFGTLHADGFPSISLIVIGLIAILCCFIPLDTVIMTLVSIRIFIQFMGQIAAVTLLRRNRPDMERPYKMWLYPLPSILAVIGWAFIYLTTSPKIMLFGAGAFAFGVAAFMAWSARRRSWPFGGE